MVPEFLLAVAIEAIYQREIRRMFNPWTREQFLKRCAPLVNKFFWSGCRSWSCLPA